VFKTRPTAIAKVLETGRSGPGQVRISQVQGRTPDRCPDTVGCGYVRPFDETTLGTPAVRGRFAVVRQASSTGTEFRGSVSER